MTISIPLRAGSTREPDEGTPAIGLWRAYLAGAPAEIDLSFLAVRSTRGPFRPESVPIPAPASAVAAMRGNGADPDSGWLVALASLVSRFTGQHEIVVGSPVGDGAVAYRIAVPRDASFADAVASLHHPDITPVAVSALADLIRPDSANGPAFAVGYQRAASPQPWQHATLCLLVPDDGVPTLGYDGTAVDRQTMQWFAAHLGMLMTGISVEQDTALSVVDVLPASERHRIVVGFNDTGTEWQDHRTFVERIADVAAVAPDATAVTYRGWDLSYHELDMRANQLAWHLMTEGVAPGEAVALFLDRSPDAVVATVAILRIGAVVVPLDPGDNDEWIAYMVRDSAATAVITDSGLSGRLPSARHTVRASARVPVVVCVDADAERIATRRAESPNVSVDPSMTSHIVYTSGSTGVPKGALSTHRNLTSLMNWMPSAYSITPESHGTWICAPGFAIGRMEWMPFLAVGAQVHVADSITAGSPERLRDWLLAGHATHTVMVTSLAQRVCALAWPQETALRFMIVLGEPVRRWPSQPLPFAVSVSYGSTEAAVVTSSYDASTGACETSAMVPADQLADCRPSVGRPIANTRIYVLDGNRAPVPVGAAGEIYVAGDGVCAGYLNLDAETRERFVATGLVEERTPTLFKTGDLGRWRQDGSLEALGRQDAQTWVRGVRVEVGEIEAVLAGMPEVREVAVVAHGGMDGGRLIGYVVPSDHRTWSADAMMAHARTRLSVYQIPEQLIEADMLPRLANGKLDRQRLPEPLPAIPMIADEAARFDPFPLTDTQQDRWIGRGDIVGWHGTGCHRYSEWECEGLDVERFRLAWSRLVRRHDALRTVIRPDATQQVLREPAEHVVPVLDLRWMAIRDADTRIGLLREQLSGQPRSSRDYPLWDVRLTQMPGNRVRVHLCLDQLIVDAWSYLHVLVPDLAAYYQDPDADLPEPRLRWRDYVMSLAGGLESTVDYQRARRYWLERMDQLPPAPALPTATGESAAKGLPSRREHRLAAQRWNLVKDRAADLSVTPAGIVIACFAEVLRAWSGSPSFTLNLTQFPRMPLHKDVGSVLGDFSTTSLLAVDTGGESFAERAMSLQRRLSADLEHGWFSGVQVAQEHAASPGGTRRMSFPVMVTDLLDQPLRRCQTAMGTVVHSAATTPRVTLDLQMSEVDGALLVDWDSMDEAYPAGMLSDLFQAYRLLVDRLVDDADSWRQPQPVIAPHHPAVADPVPAQATLRSPDAPAPDEYAPAVRGGSRTN